MECPTEQQFREKMLEGMADLRAKMNMLVGEDGTNGRVGDLEADVESLKATRSRQWGAIAAVGLIWSAALAVWEALRGR